MNRKANPKGIFYMPLNTSIYAFSETNIVATWQQNDNMTTPIFLQRLQNSLIYVLPSTFLWMIPTIGLSWLLIFQNLLETILSWSIKMCHIICNRDHVTWVHVYHLALLTAVVQNTISLFDGCLPNVIVIVCSSLYFSIHFFASSILTYRVLLPQRQSE